MKIQKLVDNEYKDLHFITGSKSGLILVGKNIIAEVKPSDLDIRNETFKIEYFFQNIYGTSYVQQFECKTSKNITKSPPEEL